MHLSPSTISSCVIFVNLQKVLGAAYHQRAEGVVLRKGQFPLGILGIGGPAGGDGGGGVPVQSEAQLLQRAQLSRGVYNEGAQPGRP